VGKRQESKTHPKVGAERVLAEKVKTMPENQPDTRTPKTLFAQWRKLQDVKNSLVKAGAINGDATPQQVIEGLRKSLPVEVFAEK